MSTSQEAIHPVTNPTGAVGAGGLMVPQYVALHNPSGSGSGTGSKDLTASSQDIKDLEGARKNSKVLARAKGAWRRRLIRMGILAAIIFLVLGVTYLVYHFVAHTEKWVTISASVPLKLNAKNCVIFIGDSPDVASGKIDVYGDVPGSELKINDNGEINVKNSISEYPGACILELLYRSGEVLSGGIVVNCVGVCTFCHRGSQSVPLNLGTGALVIGGEGKINVMIQKLIASSADIRVIRGDVHIYSATLSQDSTITSDEGDVVLQSTGNFRVSWTQNDRNLCLYAPQIAEEGSSISDCSLLYNKNPAACKTMYTLCNAGACAGSTTLTFTMGSKYGNVYANVISEDLAYVPDSYSSVMGANYSNGIQFDGILNATFSDIAMALNDTNKPDPYLHFHLGNTDAFSTRGITMLTASNTAYLNLHPWWISFLSLSLLMGKIYDVNGRLAPGFCPFRAMPTTKELSQIKALITEQSMPYVVNNRFALSFIRGSKYQTVKTEPQPNSGFLGFSNDFDLYQILTTDPNNPTLKVNYVSNQYQLVVAVAISVIIAALLGTFLLVAILYALDQFTHHYTSQSAHMLRYCEVFARKDLTEEEKMEKLLAMSAPKCKQCDSKGDKGKTSKSQALPAPGYSSFQGSYQNSSMFPGGNKDQEEDQPLNRNAKIAPEDYEHDGKKVEDEKIVICGCWLFDTLVDIVANLPSQFMFVDMIMREIQVWIFSSSSRNFYRLLFKKVDCDMRQKVDEPFSKIKLEYEKYCFLKQLTEENLIGLENRKYLESLGFYVDERCDSTTEVLKKLRTLTDKEHRENNFEESGIELDQDISSLELFMKMNYRESEFETDSILFSEFVDEYREFCEKHRLKVVVVTKPLLQDTYGINSARKTSTYLIRKGQLENASTVYYDLSYSAIKEEIKSMLDEGTMNKSIIKLRHSKTLASSPSTVPGATGLSAAEEKSRRREEKDALIKLWPLFDLAAVISHLAILAFMVAAPLLLPMFIQLGFTRFSLAEPRDAIRWEDFQYTPWTVLYKWPHYSAFSKTCCIIAIVYLCISIIDLLIYYAYISFPVETMRNYYSHRRRAFWLDLALQKLAWVYIFVVMFLAMMYFGLVIVWSILGAVLNPNAYLVYATAAGTFVTYVSTKVVELTTAYRKGRAIIIKELDKKLMPFLNEIMKKMLLKAGYDSSISKPSKEARALAIENGKVNFIETTPLGRKIAKSQLAIRNVIGMVEGKRGEAEDYAKKQSIPLPIVSALIAMAKKDPNTLCKKLIKISRNPPFHIPQAVLEMIVDILNCQSKDNIPNIVSMLAREFITSLRGKYDSKQPLSPVAAMGMQIFPQLILAVHELKTYDFQKFTDTFDKMNRFVVEAVSKQKKHDDLMNQPEEHKGGGELERPAAMPVHLVQLLDVLRVVCDKAKIGRNTKKRFVTAICCLLKNLVGINRSLLNFLCIFTSRSARITHSKPALGPVCREEQHRILERTAKGLGVAPVALKLVWSAVKGNFHFDEHFVNQCAEWYTEKINCPLPNEYFEIFFTMINIFKRKNVDHSAEKFGIDKDCAVFFDCIGNNRSLGPKFYPAFMKSRLANILSARLRIEPDCVLGLICLIKGDINNKYVDEVLKSFCKRNRVSDDFIIYIKALLTLLVHKDPNALAEALATLGKPYDEFLSWLLMGRRRLHPKHVPDAEFERLQLPVKTRAIIKDRDALLMTPDSPITWDMWLADMKYLLRTNQPEGIAGKEMPSCLNVCEAIPVPSVTVKEGSDCSATCEESKKDAKKAQVVPDDTQKNDPIKEMKERQNVASFLLGIEHLHMGIMDLKRVLGNKPLPLNDETALDNICRLLSIRNLTHYKDKTLTNLSAHNVAIVLNLDPDMVIALSTVLLALEDADTMRQALQLLFVGEATQEYLEFGMHTFDHAQLRASIKSGFAAMSRTFNMPPAIPALILASDEDSEPYQITFQHLSDVFDIFTKGQSGMQGAKVRCEKGTINERQMEIDVFKYNLCGLAAGQMNALSSMLSLAGVPSSVHNVIELMVRPQTRQVALMMREKLEALRAEHNVPLSVYHKILAIFAFYSGNGNDVMLPNERGIEQTAIAMLARQLGILPEALECIDTIMKNKEGDVLRSIKALVKVINVLRGETVLNPDYISGLFSLMTGRCIGLEDFAEKIKVKLEYLVLFIKLGFFSRSEDEIDQHIRDFKQSPTLGLALKYLRIQPDIIESLVRLSFNKAKYEDIPEILGRLGLKGCVDEEFMLMLIAIASGQYMLPQGNEPAIPSTAPLRTELHNNLHKHVRPMCKRLRIDEDIAELAISLRQGDFYFLEDHYYLVKSLLPSPMIRDVCMACCGLVSLKVEYQHSCGVVVSSARSRLSFQGACELLCGLLHMDPIVPELVTFNEGAYSSMVRRVRRGALAWAIVTISNIPVVIMEELLMKEFYRYLHEKKTTLQNKGKPQEHEQEDAFNTSEYKDMLEKWDKDEPLDNIMDDDKEVFETFVYNMPKCVTMRYEDMQNHRKRIKSFMVKDPEATRILGDKVKYYTDMEEQFATDKFDRKKKGLEEYCWINEDDKVCIKNVWAVIKEMLKDVASRVAPGEPQYDPITPAQIVLISSLMGMRGMAETISPATMLDVNTQNLFAINAELFCMSLELLAFKHNLFGAEYSRDGLLDVLSCALGVWIPQEWRDKFLNSIYENELALKVSQQIDRPENVEATINDITNFRKSLHDGIKSKETGTTLRFERYDFNNMSEDETLLSIMKDPYDLIDSGTIFYKDIKNPLFKYEYRMAKDDPFFDEKEDLNFVKELKRREVPEPKDDDKILPDLVKRRRAFCKFFMRGRKKADLLCKLAANNFEALDTYAPYLEEAGLVPKLDSIKIYQGLSQLVGLRVCIQNQLGKPEVLHASRTRQVVVPWLRPLLERLTLQMHMDNLLVENIIMLAHGVHTETTMAQLAVCCNVNPQLLQSIILVSMPMQKYQPRRSKVIANLQPLLKSLELEDLSLSTEQNNLITQLFKIVYGHKMEPDIDESGWVTLMRKDFIVNRKVENGALNFRRILKKIIPSKLCLRPEEGLVEDCFSCVELSKNNQMTDNKEFADLVYVLSTDPASTPTWKGGANIIISVLIDLMVGRLPDIFKHLTFKDDSRDKVEVGELIKPTIEEQKTADRKQEVGKPAAAPASLREITEACFMLCQRSLKPSKRVDRREYANCVRIMKNWMGNLAREYPVELENSMVNFAEELVALVYGRGEDLDRPFKNDKFAAQPYHGIIERLSALASARSFDQQMNKAVFQALCDLHTFFAREWSELRKAFDKGLSDLRSKKEKEFTLETFKSEVLSKTDSRPKLCRIVGEPLLHDEGADLPQSSSETAFFARIEALMDQNKDLAARDAFTTIFYMLLEALNHKNPEKGSKEIQAELTKRIVCSVAKTESQIKDPTIPRDDKGKGAIAKLCTPGMQLAYHVFEVSLVNEEQFFDAFEFAGKGDSKPILALLHEISKNTKESIGQYSERLRGDRDKKAKKPISEVPHVSAEFFSSILADSLLLLQAVEFNLFSAAEVARAAGHIFETISATLDTNAEPLRRIVSSVVGFDIDYKMPNFNALKVKIMTPASRAEYFIKAFIDIYMKDFSKSTRLIREFSEFLVALLQSAGNKEELDKLTPTMGEQIGLAFSINPQETIDAVKAMQYDVQALADFVGPYCRLNVVRTKNLVEVLADTHTALVRLGKMTIAESPIFIDDSMRATYSSMMRKVTEGTANLRDLFKVVDMEGDSSGGISKLEFKSLLSKLNITASDHRISEIFSTCKSKMSSKIDELDENEFCSAIRYVQTKRMGDALCSLGLSMNRLIFTFLILTVILLLLFVFIFTGIQAFSLGGSFGSAINGLLPVAAGFAVSNQESAGDTESEDGTEKVRAVIEDVIRIIDSEI